MKAKFKIGDKVRILDGSKIKNYTCRWNEQDMGKYIGKIYTIRALHDWGNRIGYKLNGAYWYEFDERGLEAVNKDQKIIITADSKTTTARLFEGKILIKSAEAKCHPDDEFDFEIGAKTAFDRLVDREEKVKPKELLKNGVFGKTNEDKWFVFVDGMFVYEDGNYDIIEDINENLIFCYKGSIRPVNALVKSNCFKNAKLNFKLNKDVIWRR